MKYWKLIVMAMTALTTATHAQNAGNHNPAFSVPDTFLSGDPYIFIGKDDAVAEANRTPVELKYRKPETPTEGTTTLLWEPTADKVDSYDSTTDLAGVKDGEDTANSSGSWTWTDDDQSQFEGKTIYLQGKTTATGGDTATLKSYHSNDPSQMEFSKEFTLLHVAIEPDSDMAGTIGDVIESADVESTIKHFVTPKESSELDQEYVILKATGITEEQITPEHSDQIFEWDGGDEVPNEPLKRRVKRDTAEKTKVKIKVKQGGTVAAQMYVWVVWADVDVTVATDYQFLPSNTPTDRWSYSSSQLREDYWRFRFTIQPAEIITATDTDRPKLDGANSSEPPGHGSNHHVLSHFPSDHASHKWDTSRQLEVTVVNFGLIPKANFPEYPEYANQPKALDVPVPFPNDPVQGNDDPGGVGFLDEDSNPYEAYQDSTRPDLAHEIGQISSSDRPEFKFLNSMGTTGSTLAVIANFNEFARLNLKPAGDSGSDGEGWYRISDHTHWHYVMSATYGEHPEGSGVFRWVDSSSVSATGRFNISE